MTAPDTEDMSGGASADLKRSKARLLWAIGGAITALTPASIAWMTAANATTKADVAVSASASETAKNDTTYAAVNAKLVELEARLEKVTATLESVSNTVRRMERKAPRTKPIAGDVPRVALPDARPEPAPEAVKQAEAKIKGVEE